MFASIYMYTLFNFAAANSLVEQLLLFLYSDLYKSSDCGFVSFSSGRQMTSVYFVGASF